jgi:hypothetical protein
MTNTRSPHTPVPRGATIPKRRLRSILTRPLVTVAAAIGVASLAAAPASAWPVDHPRITGQDVHFGSNWNSAFAAPADGGILRWDTTGGIVTPTLSGKLYMTNSAGLEGRLRVEYYDANRSRIMLWHSQWYPAAAGFNAFNIIDFAPFGAANVYAVTVKTEVKDAIGDIQTTGSVDAAI